MRRQRLKHHAFKARLKRVGNQQDLELVGAKHLTHVAPLESRLRRAMFSEQFRSGLGILNFTRERQQTPQRILFTGDVIADHPFPADRFLATGYHHHRLISATKQWRDKLRKVLDNDRNLLHDVVWMQPPPAQARIGS